MQIFISHSSIDAETAGKICDFLEKNGMKCFIAPRDIRSGKAYAEEIIDGIDRSTAMILLMSQNANRSPHVLREVERAVSKSVPILVYKMEEVALSKSMEYFLMTHQWLNAGSNDGFDDILAGLQNLTGGTQTARSDIAAAAAFSGRNAENVKKSRKRWPIAAAALVLAAVLAVSCIYLRVKNGSASAAMHSVDVEVGDTVSFGSYNGEDILWRILKISDDGSQAVLVSADILSMKAFDAAESGKYNWENEKDYWSRDSEADTDLYLQARVRGSNIWSTSNIRTWLNSADEVVSYADQPPASTAMAELRNGYEHEPGFLHDFTEAELSAIVETEILTAANPLLDVNTVTTMDKVYLLSREELQWFDEAGISKLAVPTQAAVDRDQSAWYLSDYTEFGIREYCWWLRDPAEDSTSKCYLVNNGYNQELLRQENAGLEGYGVRPALTVDLKIVTFRE